MRYIKNKKNFNACLILLSSILLQSCSSSNKVNLLGQLEKIVNNPYHISGTWYQPISNIKNFKQKGVASWYGRNFHGKKTSNGEIYDMNALTAAHKTLPLNSLVVVKNLYNNKCVIVRINDRGPFIKNRIIDLSYEAAKKIDMIKKGTSKIEIKLLK